MRKKIIISIIGFIVVVSLIFFYQREKRYNLYIMDIEKNMISQIGDKKYKIDEIVWSNDSQKFMFINEKSNSIMPPYFDRLILCRLPNYKISILPFDLTSNFKYRDIIASFINNDEMYVYRYNSKNQSLYEF